MADWPTVDQVKRRIGVTRADDAATADVQLALNAAIETVQLDAAGWLAAADPVDVPDARLASAALVLAVSCYKAPDAPFGVAGIFDTAAIAVRGEHPTYVELMRGHRTNWGIG